MSLPKPRQGFFKRLSKNLENVDKQILLTQLVSESENLQSLSALLDRLDVGVVIVSPQGEIDFVNTAAKRLLGLHKKNAHAFWTQLTDRDLRSFFESQIPHLTSEITQTLHILNPNEHNLKIHIHPHIFTNPTRHFISLLDLTGPISTEVDRLARNRFESLLRLAGGLAHEIGNPLNAISLHAELLKKQLQKLNTPNPSKMNETLEIIQDEIKRLDRTVRNFLKTTRRTPLRFRMMNLCALIQDIAKMMRPSLEERDITLHLEIPDKLEFFLDEERIRSLLINLIQNSLEAMKEGGRLDIHVSVEGQAVRIVVQDTGKGIPEEDQPHIFDAYFTTKDHGSGLGLLFVYDAVTDHGGKIQVESRVGKGTKFEILLPLRRSNLQIKHITKLQDGAKDNDV